MGAIGGYNPANPVRNPKPETRGPKTKNRKRTRNPKIENPNSNSKTRNDSIFELNPEPKQVHVRIRNDLGEDNFHFLQNNVS